MLMSTDVLYCQVLEFIALRIRSSLAYAEFRRRREDVRAARRIGDKTSRVQMRSPLDYLEA
jgi:hypothetical protein